MPSPYSLDLRKRAVDAYIGSDYSKKEIAAMFSISEKTLYLWVIKYKYKNGNLEAKTGYQNRHSHVIKDEAALIKIMNHNEFSTLAEVVEKVGSGSTSSLSRQVKKHGYVKKKAKNYTKNWVPKK